MSTAQGMQQEWEGARVIRGKGLTGKVWVEDAGRSSCLLPAWCPVGSRMTTTKSSSHTSAVMPRLMKRGPLTSFHCLVSTIGLDLSGISVDQWRHHS